MSEKNNITPDYNLLAKYFAGETTPDEKIIVENWINLSSDNKKTFERIHTLWNSTNVSFINTDIDTEKAWQKLKNRIDETAQNPEKRKNLFISERIKRIIQIAALAVFALIAGFAVTEFFFEKKYISENTNNTPEYLTLHDSSTVWLNANSVLQFPEKFENKKRAVKLSGEAFFKIKSDPKNPFIIETDYTQITVLGTEFNVEAYDTAKYVKVTVVSGKVQFSDTRKNLSKINLSKGEAAIIEKSTGKITKDNEANTNKYFVHTKTLIFKKTELYVVAETLSQVYGEKIIVEKDNLKHCKLTATFKDAQLSEILTIISSTLGVEIRRADNNYYLSGEKCM